MSFYDAIRVGASGAAEDFEIDRSVRYNRSDNSYFSKQPSSAGNRRTFTISTWVKRSNTGVHGALFYAGTSVGANHDDTDSFRFNPSDQLIFEGEESQTVKYQITTNRKFRDPSAWYHIVLAVDTTQSTSSNRIKFYVNGVQETSLATTTYPSQNYELFVNSTVSGGYTSGNIHVLGYTGGGRGLDGYLAEYHLIDGFQYDPSYFGETNANTNQWNPIKYIGGYGTNGFYLNFLDNSGTTATTLGKDSSGNGNNYTPNNFVTGDAVKDSPTNNFATLQIMGTPFSSGASFSEGNLNFTSGSSGSARNLNRQAFAPMLVNSGKWYAEFMQKGSDGYNFIGVGAYQVLISPTANNTRYAYLLTLNGEVYKRTAGSETNTTHGSSASQYDVIGVYLNMDAGTPVVYFSKNGQWADGSGNFDESSPTSAVTLGDSFFTTDTGGNDGFATFILSSANSGSNVQIHANFGQDSTFAGQITAGGNVDANGLGDFKYTVPTGAKALCSANLPNPTILLPNKHFDTLLYTGNDGSQSITGLNFQPDWAWIKERSGAYHHSLTDSVRGVLKTLSSSRIDIAEYSESSGLNQFLSNGLGFNGRGYFFVNRDTQTYAAWNWNAGDTDSKTYTVTVVDDSGNKYRFDGFGTSAVTLDLAEGGTYIFNYPSAHPFRFSTTADGTHGGGSEYTTGVTVISSTSIQIVVAASAPQLYYYCSSHSGMGGAINTNSSLGSSNFDGNIQSTVKVNATAGFSIVSYTGTGADATIGHGLGVTPSAIILKNRDRSVDWVVKHKSATSGYILYLNLNGAADGATGGNNGIIADLSSSSNFSITRTSNSGNYNLVGVNGEKYIAYCFSEVAGYSKFGSFISNGNVDGAFVFTGFRPAWVMLKQSTSSDTAFWFIFDSTRSPKNVIGDEALAANLNEAEGLTSWSPNTSNSVIDFLSNGFKIRTTSTAGFNVSGETMIYFAFAESPFKNARAR